MSATDGMCKALEYGTMIHLMSMAFQVRSIRENSAT